MKLDGKVLHSVVNTKPESFENVMVYASDPWHPTVNGKLRNLVLAKNAVF